MYRFLLFTTILLLIPYELDAQDVVINEFMSYNESSITDEDGDHEDWIELYNNTDIAISLNGYHLTDNDSNLTLWTFPSVSIAPHDFLLVMASGKDRLDINELHTNFKISADGEPLILSNSLGVILDQSAPVELPEDVSYGRIPDGASFWTNILIPNPGSTNNQYSVLSFSHPSGFYTDSFSQVITTTNSDSIFYTLDGSIPSANSMEFDGSLLIVNRNSDPNIISEIPTSPDQSLITYKAWESPEGLVKKATCLRCAAFRNGQITSEVYSKTFFVEDESSEASSLPIISLMTDSVNFFSQDSGIYIPGVNFDPDIPDLTGNYFKRGEAWERPIHIEYFEEDRQLAFTQDAGIRIHGGYTRHAGQKSLRLYARERYGKEKFNYPLMPNRPNTKYKRFILRGTMSVWGPFFKDEAVHDIGKNLDVNYQDSRPVVVYLNGEYWGIHTIRDRIDERYIEYTTGVDKDSVAFNNGDSDHYNNMIQFIENNDLSIANNYQYIGTQMDIDNYIDYTIVEHYFTNYDWPDNNIKMWRPLDGKWRWILFDFDLGFNEPDYNMLLHATLIDPDVTWPNPPHSTLLFRKLLENDLFKDQFICRYVEIINTVFLPNLLNENISAIKEKYYDEMPSHISRWHLPVDFSNWEDGIENILFHFIQERPNFVKNNLQSFFNISSNDIPCDDAFNELDISNNQVLIYPNPNTGDFMLFSNLPRQDHATIVVINSQGETIFTEKDITIKKSSSKHINLPNPANGIYLVRVYTNYGTTYQARLIIQD